MTPGDTIGVEDLPAGLGMALDPAAPAVHDGALVIAHETRSLQQFKDEAERTNLVAKLRANEWNIAGTAKAFEMKKASSEGKLEIAKSRFALGVATNLDITDSQKDLLDAEIDLLESIRDYNIGLAELERSVGGPI